MFDDSQKISTKASSFLSCPLCTKKYIQPSLVIHWPQCLKKWEIEQINDTLSPTKQKTPKLPLEIQGLIQKYPLFKINPKQVDEWNQIAQRIYENTLLLPCQYCSRKFLSDRLVVHLRSCASTHDGVRSVGFAGTKGITVGLDSGISAKTAASRTAANLVSMNAMSSNTSQLSVAEDTFPTCVLCRRKFGTTSFPIHLIQCGKKHNISNDELEKILFKVQNLVKDGVRGMSMKDKKEVGVFVEKERIDLANEAAYDNFMDQRIPCKSCKRKFDKERIEKHSSICKG